MEKHPAGFHKEFCFVDDEEVSTGHRSKWWSHQVLVGQSCALYICNSVCIEFAGNIRKQKSNGIVIYITDFLIRYPSDMSILST